MEVQIQVQETMKPKAASLLLGLLVLMNVAVAGETCFAAWAEGGSLADAYGIIASKQFVDLTHSFSPLTPVWKGFGQATFSRAADPQNGRPYTIENDHFRAFFYSMTATPRPT